MGLDMYAYKTKQEIETEVDFTVEEDQMEELHYWRKHANLHGWMEQLYMDKGGKEEFNCVPVLLTLNDLEQLEQDLKGNLPHTTGFFFGSSAGSAEEHEDDMSFIKDARQAIEEGYKVYYTSWW